MNDYVGNLKGRGLVAYVLFAPILMICLPYSQEKIMTIDLLGIPIFICVLLHVPLLIKALINGKSCKSNYPLYLCFLFMSFGLVLAQDNNIQRFLIGVQFFIPYLIFNQINFSLKDFKIIRVIILIAFVFVVLQVFLFATGSVELDTGDTTEMGQLIRRGTSAGGSTITGYLIAMFSGVLFSMVQGRLTIILWVTTVIAVFYTGTRGALMLYLLASVIWLFLNKSKFQSLVFLVLAFTLFSFFDSEFKFSNIIDERNMEAIDDSDISSGRFDRWQDVVSIFKLDPEFALFGIGGANTPYYDDCEVSGIKSIVSPHNVYLSFILEHGIFSLLLFLYFLFDVLREIKEKSSFGYLIIVFSLLITFNTEVVPRGWLFAFIFWLLYFVAKNNHIKINDKVI